MPTRRRRLPIVRLGDPILRRTATELPVEDVSSRDFQRFVDRLLRAMRGAEGVGLAAPQVGVSSRLFVWGALPEIAEQVVINPIVEPTSPAIVEGWEGCLSIPGLRGLVPRFRRVRLRGLDRFGEPIDRRMAGYEARIVQHELDHLDGVVFLDRMTDLTSLGFDEEVERANDAESDEDSSSLGA
jgi:peptide deformylase